MNTDQATDEKDVLTFGKVCSILERYNYDSRRLIPILQEVQEEYRYLPESVMTFVAASLNVPPARVYGVATFYAHFTLKPKGKYVVKLCDGTACHVKRSELILNHIRACLGLKDGENTTPDMLFTVETVSCLGACGLAPVVVINEAVYGQVTPPQAEGLIDEIRKNEGVI